MQQASHEPIASDRDPAADDNPFRAPLSELAVPDWSRPDRPMYRFKIGNMMMLTWGSGIACCTSLVAQTQERVPIAEILLLLPGLVALVLIIASRGRLMIVMAVGAVVQYAFLRVTHDVPVFAIFFYPPLLLTSLTFPALFASIAYEFDMRSHPLLRVVLLSAACAAAGFNMTSMVVERW